MPDRRISIDAIRAELAWVNEPVDPNVCGCRHLLCCEQTSHAVGKCPRAPTKRCGVFDRNIFVLSVGRITSVGVVFEVTWCTLAPNMHLSDITTTRPCERCCE